MFVDLTHTGIDRKLKVRVAYTRPLVPVLKLYPYLVISIQVRVLAHTTATVNYYYYYKSCISIIECILVSPDSLELGRVLYMTLASSREYGDELKAIF